MGPVQVWLDAPLRERAAPDADTNWKCPLFVPDRWRGGNAGRGHGPPISG